MVNSAIWRGNQHSQGQHRSWMPSILSFYHSTEDWAVSDYEDNQIYLFTPEYM